MEEAGPSPEGLILRSTGGKVGLRHGAGGSGSRLVPTGKLTTGTENSSLTFLSENHAKQPQRASRLPKSWR